jgi:hypothetical protein
VKWRGPAVAPGCTATAARAGSTPGLRDGGNTRHPSPQASRRNSGLLLVGNDHCQVACRHTPAVPHGSCCVPVNSLPVGAVGASPAAAPCLRAFPAPANSALPFMGVSFFPPAQTTRQPTSPEARHLQQIATAIDCFLDSQAA